MFSVYVTVQKLVSHWNSYTSVLIHAGGDTHTNTVLGAHTNLTLHETSQVQYKVGMKGAPLTWKRGSCQKL